MWLVAEDGGELVGCCRLDQRPGGEAYFGMFSVRPGQQGRGRGREILAKALAGAPNVRTGHSEPEDCRDSVCVRGPDPLI
jgi:N-acetylglutamate synthase-like GNAT family acetyltransferase